MNPLLEKRAFIVTENVALATETFQLTLTPADGTKMFPFVAGQWVYLYLLHEDGSEWGRAAFSVASSPSESTQYFQLAIKIHADFTRRAQKLKSGDAVRIPGPFGVFTLRSGSAPLVMCAGGIGIAPFRSMIREMHAMKDARPVTLFYSNHTRQDTAYLEEFVQLAATYPSLLFVPIYTREVVVGAYGRRFDEAMLVERVPELEKAEYLTCGPDMFMDALKQVLLARSIDPKFALRKELFT